jgi:hypothetical protein
MVNFANLDVSFSLISTERETSAGDHSSIDRQ